MIKECSGYLRMTDQTIDTTVQEVQQTVEIVSYLWFAFSNCLRPNQLSFISCERDTAYMNLRWAESL